MILRMACCTVHLLKAFLLAGVLAGAIDYYIVAKFQNLRNDALYVKVTA